MVRLFHYRRARTSVRRLAATQFCDNCGAVCTPDCRREMRRARQYHSIQHGALFRV